MLNDTKSPAIPLHSHIHRIPTSATLHAINLPERIHQQLAEIATRLSRSSRHPGNFPPDPETDTRGTTALFIGATGTGKAVAAQLLAKSLGSDLLRVDLVAVSSKYIGETEKNMDRVFKEAVANNAVLLFDEADALLGKRSEVKDAHDRYANLDVSYLLQRIEEHNGLVILTTNRRENIDPAFLRRLRYVIEFGARDPP
jgi:SpoVK/Ycf46/Vps4 family AAA+-type ATPase